MPRAPVDVPHHHQEEGHTCGPAAAKMVLDALWGLRLEEPSLAQRLGAREDIGTRQKAMARLMATLGLGGLVRHTDTTLEELYALVGSHVVIVCYWLAPEDTDHYAVVVAMDKTHITLHDPWVGPAFILALPYFDAHWHGDDRVEGRRDRWLLAVPVPATS